ncbi:hypothetical protein Fot_42912 [Forsythia ovata]|uniref:Uncharacterized protein n=1 Tax=Forsythia ovata TaxID=205694 RepID=A0ABD1RMI9_9LAMI
MRLVARRSSVVRHAFDTTHLRGFMGQDILANLAMVFIQFAKRLDPTILGKLPPPAAKTTASVHKYWTSAFGKAADNTELTELLKLVEMYTSRSHVLNCELYKLLKMKVDELRSITGGMRMLKHCAQKTKTFGGNSYSPKTRGLVPRIKPGQSRRHVSMLRKRPSCS